MPTTMIERLAPALAYIVSAKGGEAGTVDEMREEAANLIRLMRDPTDAMEAAWAEVAPVGGSASILHWQAMIDAALGEGPGMAQPGALADAASDLSDDTRTTDWG